MRLVYYCIVQTITRIGSSWYQLQYGFGSAAEYDATDASLLKSTIYLSEFILNPSAGIGYLVIFLNIQPEAWRELKRLTGWERRAAEGGGGTGKGSMKYLHRGGGGGGEMDCGDSLTVSPLLDDQSREGSLYSGGYRIFGDRDREGDEESESDGLGKSQHTEGRGEEEDGENRISNVASSTPESLFPLLEMDEADLAKEIDRLYFNQPPLLPAFGRKW
jgi:hypothetical protein